MACFTNIRTVLVSLFILGCVETVRSAYCTPKKKTTTKTFPEITFEKYSVDYRATFIEKGYSITASEISDLSSFGGVSRMETHFNGKTQIRLIRTSTRSYIDYTANDDGEQLSCNVITLSEANIDSFRNYGYLKTTRGLPLIALKYLIRERDDVEYDYVNSPTINGIETEHWQSCQMWKDTDATFTVDLYFTKYQSIGFDSRSSLVQAVIKGEVGSGAAKNEIHHIYDIFGFKAYRDNGYRYSSDFPSNKLVDMPDFAVCTGSSSSWNKKFPTLMKSVTYTLETVKYDSNGKDVTLQTKTVQRDAGRKLLREHRGSTISISDFNLGVEFIMDNTNFQARPIDPKNVPSAVRNGGNIEMGDAPEMAYLQQDLFYAGPKEYRNKMCDVFTGYARNNDIIQVYVNEVNLIHGIKIYSPSTKRTLHYNIFNYRSFHFKFDNSLFIISDRVSTNHVKEFTIIITTSSRVYEYDFESKKAGLIASIRDNIVQIVGVSTVQISHVSLNLTSNNDLRWVFSFVEAYWEADQLDIVSALYSTFDRSWTYDSTVYEPYGVPWTSNLKFSYFENLNNYLSVSSVGNVDKGFRASHDECVTKIEGSTSSGKSLEECAEDCVGSKERSCTFFQYTKATKLCQLGLQSEYSLVSTPGCTLYEVSYMRHFEFFPGAVSLSKKGAVIKTVKSNDLCAKSCLEEKSFQCESFDYCTNDNSCILRKTHYYDSDPDDNAEVNSCEHYSRYILDDYHLEFSTKVSYDGQVTEMVERDSQCAKMCSLYEEGCHSFSTCYDTEATGHNVLACAILPLSKKDDAKIEHNQRYCFTYKALGSVSARVAKTVGAKAGGSYTAGSMFGLAIGMILTGVGIGALTVLLLKHFQIWQGF